MGILQMRSTDRGVPTLTGQQGSLGALLMKCLAEGYPSFTQGANGASATSGDFTEVTLHLPGHGFSAGQEVTVSGLDAEFNGRVVLTATSSDFIFYTKTGTSSYPTGGSAVVGGEALVGTATSITRSGTTVTVNLTAHGFSVGQRARLAGADAPEYNGRQRVATVVSADAFTFELPAAAVPTTPATGTIKVYYGSCGLGWEAQYSATNRRVFRQGTKGAQARHVLVVDETNATQHTYGAMLGMAEAATSVSALTGKYYANLEANVYLGTVKSATADATARAWVVVGDARTFILLTQPGYIGDSSIKADGWCPNYFGDYISFLPGDTSPILSGPATYNGYGMSYLTSTLGYYGSSRDCFIGNVYNYCCGYTNSETYNHPLRIRKNHLGASGYIQPVLFSPNEISYMINVNGGASYHQASAQASPSYFTMGYPDPVHGGFNIDSLYLIHNTGADNAGAPVLRGRVRGLYQFLHNRPSLPVANNDTFSGAGAFSGKTFEVFDFTYLSSTLFGCFVVETSDTWEA